MSRVPYTTDLLNLAKELINSGLLIKEAANKLGVTPDILSRKLKSTGYTIPRHYRPAHNAKKFDVEFVVNSYISGNTIDNLSKITGAERRTIKSTLVDNGVAIRTNSEVMFNRMEELSLEDRKKLTNKANEACRGVEKTRSHKIKIAKTNEARNTRLGPGEHKLINLLRDRGFHCIPQFAFEIYNIDIMVNTTVAVELNLGSQDRYTQAKYIDRSEHILESYNIMTISVDTVKAMVANIDNIISDLNILCTYPASASKMKMVRCRSETCVVLRDEKGKFTSIPSTEEFSYIS